MAGWKGHPYIIFKEAEHNRFYNAVKGGGEQWKGHPYIISKKAECSGFYKGVENNKKSISI